MARHTRRSASITALVVRFRIGDLDCALMHPWDSKTTPWKAAAARACSDPPTPTPAGPSHASFQASVEAIRRLLPLPDSPFAQASLAPSVLRLQAKANPPLKRPRGRPPGVKKTESGTRAGVKKKGPGRPRRTGQASKVTVTGVHGQKQRGRPKGSRTKVTTTLSPDEQRRGRDERAAKRKRD
ncbi:MAG: hypothetical protein Q9222_000817 [Ikaeria aurantiellina]